MGPKREPPSSASVSLSSGWQKKKNNNRRATVPLLDLLPWRTIDRESQWCLQNNKKDPGVDDGGPFAEKGIDSCTIRPLIFVIWISHPRWHPSWLRLFLQIAIYLSLITLPERSLRRNLRRSRTWTAKVPLTFHPPAPLSEESKSTQHVAPGPRHPLQASLTLVIIYRCHAFIVNHHLVQCLVIYRSRGQALSQFRRYLCSLQLSKIGE